MSEQTLIICGAPVMEPIALTPDAIALKEQALTLAALIGKVTNAEENATAVDAQKELKRVSDMFESERVKLTKPLLDLQRKLKAAVDAQREELGQELLRVTKLVGDFQALELAKLRAAEAARRKELDEIERLKQAEIAKAKSHEEIEQIHERSNSQAAALPVVQPVKAAGQIVREEWEFEVADVWALARAHPALVNIEPRRREIKELLAIGVTVAGIRAWKSVKSSVRTASRQSEAIGV